MATQVAGSRAQAGVTVAPMRTVTVNPGTTILGTITVMIATEGRTGVTTDITVTETPDALVIPRIPVDATMTTVTTAIHTHMITMVRAIERDLARIGKL